MAQNGIDAPEIEISKAMAGAGMDQLPLTLKLNHTYSGLADIVSRVYRAMRQAIEDGSK